MLTIIERLLADIASVSEDDMKRGERHITPVDANEKPLGVIHNEAARKLWALSYRIQLEAGDRAYRSKLAATDDEAKALALEGMALVEYAALARKVFWAQIKEDVGTGSAYALGEDENGIGIRSGWMVVSTKANPADALVKKILGIE